MEICVFCGRERRELYKRYLTVRGEKGEWPICDPCWKRCIDACAYDASDAEYEFEKFREAWKALGGKSIAMKKVAVKYAKFPKKLKTTILDALVAQHHERQLIVKRGGFLKQLKMPATWINQECWNDEIQSEQEIIDEANRSNRGKPALRRNGLRALFDLDS